MVLKNWIRDCTKTYKKFDKVMEIITEAIQNLRMDLTAEEKNLAGLKIQGGIFQGDVLSLLQFAKAKKELNVPWRNFRVT